MNPKKVLILTIKAGGGHRNTAKITQTLLDQHGIKNKIWEVTDDLPKFRGRSLTEWYYNITAVRFPILWTITVFLSEVLPSWLILWIYDGIMGKAINAEIEREKPDFLISTYCYFAPLIEQRYQIPTVTIVSDPFTPISYWFLGKSDNIVVMSQEVYNFALDKKISADRLKLIEPMINPKFLQVQNEDQKKDFKKQLQLEYSNTILILAGGEGLSGADKIVRKITSQISDVNVLVVCGRDEMLQAKLEKFQAESGLSNLKIFGFTGQVYELINAANVVVSKAGPATILETLALGKPIVLTSYHTQERGNKDFVITGGYGFYEPNLDVLPSLLKKILSSEQNPTNIWKPTYDPEKLLSNLLIK